MNWFEKKFGKYAIDNLPLMMIICYGFGYVLQYVNASFLNYLTLNPYAIVHGQVWRLVTWVLVPPDSTNVFLVLVAMLFYYSIGTSLERTWGKVAFNEYIFLGLLFTVAGAFVMMGVSYLVYGSVLESAAVQYFDAVSQCFSTYYVSMSIFLAYAATFPDAVVLFMFILPVKVKWLGILYAVLLGIDFVRAAAGGGFYICIAMLASLLNFAVYYFRSRDLKRFRPKEVKRRTDFRRAVQGTGQHRGAPAPAGKMRQRSARHRCAICGRTELDDPTLEFRYCSKCDGNYEFCQDHLFSHVHAKNGSAPVPAQQTVEITPGPQDAGKE